MKSQTITCFWLLVAVLSVSTISSQKRINPFEIISRLDTLQNSEKNLTPEDFSETNEDSILSSSTEDGINTTGRDIADPKFNPFEVDHIPLRRSKLAELEQKIDFSTALISSTAKSNNFLIWFLLISTALLAITINAKPTFISLLYRSLLNENMLKLLQREESQKFSIHSILLYLIFGINLCSFIYLTISRFGTAKGLKMWFLIFLGILLIYSVKHITLKVFGDLFYVEKSTSIYSFTVMLINLGLGLVLIPANLFIAFSPGNVSDFTFYFTLVIILILVILRTIRGVFIASEYIGERIFQFFVYLCAFEIAPVLILVKTAMKIVY